MRLAVGAAVMRRAHLDTAVGEKFFDIAVGQVVTQVPAGRVRDHVRH
jgi:hypothetical protein